MRLARIPFPVLVGEEQGEQQEQHRRRGRFLFRLALLMANLRAKTEAALDSGTISSATGSEACEPPFVLGEGGDALPDSAVVSPDSAVEAPSPDIRRLDRGVGLLMSSPPGLPARASVLVAEMWRPQTPGAGLLPSSRAHPPSPAAAVALRVLARHSVLGAWSCRRRETATIRRPSSRARSCSP